MYVYEALIIQVMLGDGGMVFWIQVVPGDDVENSGGIGPYFRLQTFVKDYEQ